MFLVTCMSVHRVHVVLRGKKRVLGPPEVELQAAASYHVGAGNQTHSLLVAVNTLSH